MLRLATRSDDELVALLRSGEGEALAEIARRHRPMMLAVARPLLAGTPYDADDAVQDALMIAQRALAAGSARVALRPWLAVVVRNRSIDLRRRREALAAELPAGAAGAGDLVDEVSRREQVRATVRGIAALPERQRAVLVGHVFEGRSQRDIALGLGTSVGAVKALMTRARDGLAVAA